MGIIFNLLTEIIWNSISLKFHSLFSTALSKELYLILAKRIIWCKSFHYVYSNTHIYMEVILLYNFCFKNFWWHLITCYIKFSLFWPVQHIFSLSFLPPKGWGEDHSYSFIRTFVTCCPWMISTLLFFICCLLLLWSLIFLLTSLWDLFLCAFWNSSSVIII